MPSFYLLQYYIYYLCGEHKIGWVITGAHWLLSHVEASTEDKKIWRSKGVVEHLLRFLFILNCSEIKQKGDDIPLFWAELFSKN